MKFAIAIPLAAITAFLVYHFDPRQLLEEEVLWYYPVIMGVMFVPMYMRLAEYILKKPMMVGGKRGSLGTFRSIPVDKTTSRIFTLLLNLGIVGLISWGYLTLNFNEKSTEEPTPSEQMEEMYNNMH